MEISDGVIRRGRTISIILHIVRGHVSEKSFSWAFYEHFSFFTETYSLNGTESTKRCAAIFSKLCRPVLCKLDMTSFYS